MACRHRISPASQAGRNAPGAVYGPIVTTVQRIRVDARPRKAKRRESEDSRRFGFQLVGATGIEPVTPTMSR
jgi:hypothetical protein